MKGKDVIKEAKDGETNKLKRRIKRLEKENARLKSEVNSLEQAFKNTRKYIDDNTENISVEKMIQAAKKGSKLKDVNKPDCEECGEGHLKHIQSPAGVVVICNNCEFRGVVGK